ncbi:MAG TPA: PHB depolymerase family esterase [Burkholderiales bacterium]|nr:PHB depolymerase family esterase [Burkholderiales bacterium]
MRRFIKRWTTDARAYLGDRLNFPLLRRARRKEGRFHTPPLTLASHLLHSVRAYRLYLPAAVSSPNVLPLLVMLHGCKQNALVFAAGTRMNQLADRHGFIVLYPEQSHHANSFGCWNWFDPAVLRGSGEAEMIAKIVCKVMKRYPVDRTRVYIAGMSAGGAMASVLANCYGTLFAACAVHSGLMYRAASSPSAAVAAMRTGSSSSAQETARPTTPTSRLAAAFVPTLVIHGDRDETVNPLNAERIIEQNRRLAEYDRMAPQPLIETAERRVASSHRAYQLRDYARDGRIVLRKIIIEGLGHAWSGGDERHPFNDSQGPDASQLIWDFLSEFRRKPGEKSTAMHPQRFFLSRMWNPLRRRS